MAGYIDRFSDRDPTDGFCMGQSIPPPIGPAGQRIWQNVFGFLIPRMDVVRQGVANRKPVWFPLADGFRT